MLIMHHTKHSFLLAITSLQAMPHYSHSEDGIADAFNLCHCGNPGNLNTLLKSHPVKKHMARNPCRTA